MSVATQGLDAVEAMVTALNALDGAAGLPRAAGFLRREAAGQRNRVVVFLLTETAAANAGGRATVVQQVVSEIGVVLLLPRRNDRGGEKALGKSEVWLDLIRRTLLGLTPPGIGARTPLAWVGGALEAGDDDGYWVWVDRYRYTWTCDAQRFQT